MRWSRNRAILGFVGLLWFTFFIGSALYGLAKPDNLRNSDPPWTDREIYIGAFCYVLLGIPGAIVAARQLVIPLIHLLSRPDADPFAIPLLQPARIEPLTATLDCTYTPEDLREARAAVLRPPPIPPAARLKRFPISILFTAACVVFWSAIVRTFRVGVMPPPSAILLTLLVSGALMVLTFKALARPLPAPSRAQVLEFCDPIAERRERRTRRGVRYIAFILIPFTVGLVAVALMAPRPATPTAPAAAPTTNPAPINWTNLLKIPALYLIALAAMVALLASLVRKHNRRFQFDRLRDPRRIQIDSDGIRFSTGGSDEIVRWSGIARCIETPNLFVIFRLDRPYEIIPKRTLSPDDLTRFRHLLRASLQPTTGGFPVPPPLQGSS